MGQAPSKEGDDSSSGSRPEPLSAGAGSERASAEQQKGLKALKRLSSGRSSTGNAESSSSARPHSVDVPAAAPPAGNTLQPAGRAASAEVQNLQQQQQQQQQQPQLTPTQQLPPRPPVATAGSSSTTLQHSYSGSSTDSSSFIAKGYRRSGSMDQGSPLYQQQRLSGDRGASLSSPAACAGVVPSDAANQLAGQSAPKPPQQPSRRSGGNSYAGLSGQAQGQLQNGPGGGSRPASFSSACSFENARASFSRDGLAGADHDWRRVASLEAQGAIRFSNAGSSGADDNNAGDSGHALKQDNLRQHNLLLQQQEAAGQQDHQQQQQQQQQPRYSSSGGGSGNKHGRASMDSVASKASAKSGRSSFAQEAEEEEPDVDHYGRPSFAAFEPTQKMLAGKGAVFEASLPPDLANMYRHLAVLLPQAPVPLVTVLQLWGCTDPQEAQENIQIFVMQGVLKVATLPDGATWVMVSPDHQQYVLAAHPSKAREWHLAVLNMYRRQVMATRFLQQRRQQQQLLQDGESAAAAMRSVADEQVLPSQFMNDGYIWLALTHHLLGAGQLDQLRQLLLDPSWLEVKLHCYGVAAVVDDFRSYLQQVGSDLLVKAVLQAFQMSLSCCMERSHLPMMRTQLVLRLMAAAQAAAAAAAAAGDGPRLSCSSVSAAPVREGQSNESLRSRLSAQQQQEQFNLEMTDWFAKQYKICWDESPLLLPQQQQQQEDGQQQQLPPHLVGYTPSLTQAGGRHRMALRGHLGPIRRVIITASGKDVLTASDDGGVQVWDMDIGDCVMQLRLEPSAAAAGPVPLTTLAVTPDGCCCLCGDAEGWLCCWNLKTGQLVQRVRAHNGRLNALALDVSGSRCMTAGQDCTAKLWSLPAGVLGSSTAGSFGGTPGTGASLIGMLKCEMEMRGHGLPHLGTGNVLDVSLSGDGVLGATASDDFSVKIWDLDQHECVKTCKGHTGWVVSVRFIGNNHTIVSASHDETARVWDAWSGDCLGVLTGHTGRLNAVRCSADGRVLVTCSDDTTARIWETRDYTCTGVLAGHTSWINDVALVRNGQQAVTTSGDGTARLWSTQHSTCLQVLTGHSDDVTCVVLTSRGRFAVTGSVDGTAQVWDLAAQDVSSKNVHEGKVIAVVASGSSSSSSSGDGGDGGSAASHAASIGADGCLRLWNVSTGACISTKAGHTRAGPQGLTMVQDGSRAFSAGGDRMLLGWDMKTGDPSVCLPAQQGSRTKCICVSKDGGTAVTLLFDSSMAVYNTADGSLRCHLMQRGDRDAQRVHSAGVNAVILSRDGSKAVSVSKDCTSRVWDTATGACLLLLLGHEDSVHAATLSPNETLLATASFDCTVRLWSMSTGDCLKVLQHTDPVLTVAFSPPPLPEAAAATAPGASMMSTMSSGSSTRLVTGCDGRALWLWDVDSGACVAALGEHKEAVTAVCFSPGGQWLASASQDRSLLVWDAATGQLAGLYVGDAIMLCCCFAARSGKEEETSAAAGGAAGGGEGTGSSNGEEITRAVAGEEAAAASADAAADTAGAASSGGARIRSSIERASSAGSADSMAVAAAAAGVLAAQRRLRLSKGEVCAACASAAGLTLVAGDASGSVHFIQCCTCSGSST